VEEIRRIIRGTIGVLVDPYDQGKIMTGVDLMIGAAGVVLAVAFTRCQTYTVGMLLHGLFLGMLGTIKNRVPLIIMSIFVMEGSLTNSA